MLQGWNWQQLLAEFVAMCETTLILHLQNVKIMTHLQASTNLKYQIEFVAMCETTFITQLQNVKIITHLQASTINIYQIT